MPGFSAAAVDGQCLSCHGTSFTAPGVAAPMVAAGFLVGGAAGAVVGAAAGAVSPDYIILCVTCGKRFHQS